MTQTRTPENYRIKGTTDDVTTCDRCGKPELKGTVVLEALDADGNGDGIVYFGSTCAGRVFGRKGAYVRRDAEVVQSLLDEAEAARREIRDYYGQFATEREAVAEYYRLNRFWAIRNIPIETVYAEITARFAECNMTF